MSITSFTVTGTMVTEYCCKCGLAFSMTHDFWSRRKVDGESFYCPSGHSQHYTETEVMRLQRAVADRDRRIASQIAKADQLRAEVRDTTNKLNAERAAKSRIKNRVAKGVCPCCNRHFSNVERHMASKHPELLKGTP